MASHRKSGHPGRARHALEHWLLAGALAVASPLALGAEPDAVTVTLRSSQDPSLRHEVRRALEKGQAWLVQQQSSNGFWSSPDYPAITALALTGLKAKPGAPESQPAAVKRGFDFLLGCVKPDGGIYQKELPGYNTSISLTALVLADRREWRPVIENARKFVVSLQTGSGGIGYGKTEQAPDLSNTSWAIEALALSRSWLGGEIPPGTADLNWKAAVEFIQSCQNLPSQNRAPRTSDDPRNQGGFIYAPGASKAGETQLASGRVALRSYGSMSYAGLMSYIYAQVKGDDPRVKAVMEWLADNYSVDENPGMGQEGLYYYYHTMTKALTVSGAGTLATRNGQNINWREQLTLKLINLQHTDGSWANENGRWFEKDPVLVSAYCVLALKMIDAAL